MRGLTHSHFSAHLNTVIKHIQLSDGLWERIVSVGYGSVNV